MGLHTEPPVFPSPPFNPQPASLCDPCGNLLAPAEHGCFSRMMWLCLRMLGKTLEIHCWIIVFPRFFHSHVGKIIPLSDTFMSTLDPQTPVDSCWGGLFMNCNYHCFGGRLLNQELFSHEVFWREQLSQFLGASLCPMNKNHGVNIDKKLLLVSGLHNSTGA